MKSKKRIIVHTIWGKNTKNYGIINRYLFNRGFSMDQEALESLHKEMQLGIDIGKIRTKRDADMAVTALILGGYKNAAEQDQNIIKWNNILEGWEMFLCPGNRPPHECLEDSILSRRNIIGDQLPDFNSIIKILKY